MTDTFFTYRGLLLDDLEDIHMWLVDDLIADLRADPEADPVVLLTFMDLVRHRSDCWGLFEEFEGIDLCIGFILFKEHDDYLEVKSFAIAPSYREQGLGRRFALTVINIMQREVSKPVRVVPVNDSDEFWGEVGFRRLNYFQPDRTMELNESVPYEPILT
jgi:ribosomal protein S18 acetylase RimI-like enzyme